MIQPCSLLLFGPATGLQTTTLLYPLPVWAQSYPFQAMHPFGIGHRPNLPQDKAEGRAFHWPISLQVKGMSGSLSCHQALRYVFTWQLRDNSVDTHLKEGKVEPGCLMKIHTNVDSDQIWASVPPNPLLTHELTSPHLVIVVPKTL